MLSLCFSLQEQKIFFEEKRLTLKNNALSQGPSHLNALTICVAFNLAAHTCQDQESEMHLGRRSRPWSLLHPLLLSVFVAYVRHQGDKQR